MYVPLIHFIVPNIHTLIYVYYIFRCYFILIFAHNSTIPTYSYDLHIVDFGPMHKAKLMVQVLFESGKVEFSNQVKLFTSCFSITNIKLSHLKYNKIHGVEIIIPM